MHPMSTAIKHEEPQTPLLAEAGLDSFSFLDRTDSSHLFDGLDEFNVNFNPQPLSPNVAKSEFARRPSVAGASDSAFAWPLSNPFPLQTTSPFLQTSSSFPSIQFNSPPASIPVPDHIRPAPPLDPIVPLPETRAR